jgi:enoyl-CoA hydratase/carnithine racemase
MTVEEPLVLRHDRADGLTTLTLNRPGQFNSLSKDMLTAVKAELDAIAADEAIRVVVIAGAGKAFCAGHDLKEMRANHSKAFMQALFKQCGELMLTLTQMPQPVIARVHGIATAAGCQLVSMCDLAVAADVAKFAVSGINVGLFCSTPAVGLARNLGRKAALEMLLTGEFIDAMEAKAKGLVNRVVPADALDAEIERLAQSIIAKSAIAVRIGKGMFYQQLEMGLAEAYDYASEVMACNMMSDDADLCAGHRLSAWHSASVPTVMRRNWSMRGSLKWRTMMLSRSALASSAASRCGWRAKMKLAAEGRTSKPSGAGRRQRVAGGDDGLQGALEMRLVLDGGDGAGDGQAIQRVGVEAVLDPLQRLDQRRVADREADAQAGQRARLGQRVDDQQVVVTIDQRNRVSPPKST